MAAESPGLWAELRAALPQGFGLPSSAWVARHRLILAILAGHALLLPLYGLYQDWPTALAIGEPALVAAITALAAWPRLSTRVRSVLAALALVTCSAILVQFSGGYIEAHFHFFIAVALIALYQDWAPFLMAILYVAVDHGVVGMLAPHWVYNHHSGIQEPWTWALIHAVAILGESAALLAFWSSAEQARARSDLVLDAAPDAIVGIDLAGRVAFANPAAAAMLGSSAEALAGRDARQALAGIDLARGGDSPREGLVATPSGRSVPVEWTLSRADGVSHGLAHVLVLRDITGRRELERQLALHQEHLEELVAQRTAQLTAANRELEAFSYTVSHDLRSPLRSIDGFSRILLARHGADLPAESRELLERLSGGAVRMGHLIESVLTLSRISRTHIADEPIDLSLMAHEMLEEMAVKEPARRVAWTVQPGLLARGDPGLVRMALSNLLANAWKFTARTPEGRISFHRVASDGAAVYVVEDNGAGFDVAHARDLFQPFHRMHQANEFEGSGIGLATVNRIVQRHGGRIWADGRPGQGARFYFTLQADPLPAARRLAEAAPLVAIPGATKAEALAALPLQPTP